MKTATTVLLGFFCMVASISCRCDPDDEEEDKNAATAEIQKVNRNLTENDSISLNR